MITSQDSFEWRGILFQWVNHRSAHVGRVTVGTQELGFFVQEPAHFQAWVEWYGGYTLPCTMPERTDALEGARLELLDRARQYHEDLLKRFG